MASGPQHRYRNQTGQELIPGTPEYEAYDMTQTVVDTEHNVVNPVSTDSNGDVVTDSSGNPAGNIVGEITGVSGVYKTFYIISDDATAMTDAPDHRIDDATGFKAFRVTPTTQTVQNTAYAWSTDASDYAALETKLTTVLGQITTPTGAAQENARVIALEGAAGTTTSRYESQPWINYDGTNTIKTITTQNAGAAQSIMVEVLV